jgi:hypothetical protein
VDEKERGFVKKLKSKDAKKIERKATQETLMTCERLRNISCKGGDFKSTTLSLIKIITFIYYSNSQVPIEQVRLGDALEALQEANQNILHFICLPH